MQQRERTVTTVHIIPDYATLARYDNVKLFFCRNLLRKWIHLDYIIYITPLYAQNIPFAIIISVF